MPAKADHESESIETTQNFSNIEALARGTHAALAAVEERRNSGFSPRY